MRRRILILGGYGNFGKRIATSLAASGFPVIIAGRSRQKADMLRHRLPSDRVETAIFDVSRDFEEHLKSLAPHIVINTCGPFQNANYHVAETCIRQKVHYIDLADGRDFVVGISKLNDRAVEAGVAVVSGASTVPGLSSAVLERFKGEFSKIYSLRYGISPGQKAERGLATTQGILSYAGKPLRPFAGKLGTSYGWQDLHRVSYPELGKRWMANCDVPDMDLLPDRYGIRAIQFSAGLELTVLHLGLWALSWLVRAGAPLKLPQFAKPLLTISNWFNAIGTADGGMHMIIEGEDLDGAPITRSWFIIAKDGHGPHIPTIPAILLAKRLAGPEADLIGAQPCVGLIPLGAYLEELSAFNIKTYMS